MNQRIGFLGLALIAVGCSSIERRPAEDVSRPVRPPAIKTVIEITPERVANTVKLGKVYCKQLNARVVGGDAGKPDCAKVISEAKNAASEICKAEEFTSVPDLAGIEVVVANYDFLFVASKSFAQSLRTCGHPYAQVVYSVNQQVEVPRRNFFNTVDGEFQKLTGLPPAEALKLHSEWTSYAQKLHVFLKTRQ